MSKTSLSVSCGQDAAGGQFARVVPASRHTSRYAIYIAAALIFFGFLLAPAAEATLLKKKTTTRTQPDDTEFQHVVLSGVFSASSTEIYVVFYPRSFDFASVAIELISEGDLTAADLDTLTRVGCSARWGMEAIPNSPVYRRFDNVLPGNYMVRVVACSHSGNSDLVGIEVWEGECP